jgi:hypothetical protein
MVKPEVSKTEIREAVAKIKTKIAAKSPGGAEKTREQLEEEYIFLRLANNDLKSAIELAKIGSDCEDDGYAVSVLKDAVITYSRPFTTNHGTHNKKLRLDEKRFVPRDFLEHHASILNMRNKLIAHLDISAWMPHLMMDAKPPLISIRAYYRRDLVTPCAGIFRLVPGLIEGINPAIEDCEKSIRSLIGSVAQGNQYSSVVLQHGSADPLNRRNRND